MQISFNPSVKVNNPNFKSLKDGFIDPVEVTNYTNANLLAGDIKMGGAYKPTVDNFDKNLQALDEAKEIAQKDKNFRRSILMSLDDAKEALTEEARKLKIIK